MNRRGSISDSVVWVVMLVMMLVVFSVGYIVLFQLNDMIQTESIGTNESLANMQDFTDRYPNIFDGIFVTIFFGMIISSILFSLTIPTNPGLAFVGMIVFSIVLVLTAMLGNWVDEFSKNSIISGYISGFPMANFIWDNIVFIIVAWMFLVGVIVWAKIQRS